MIPNCIPLVQSAAHSVLRAKNMHQFRSKVYLVIALLNVIGTLLLVRHAVDYICGRNGGSGAVRKFIDKLVGESE